MKNKNIIKSFKAIEPTKEEKKLMLENILQRKKKILPFYKILTPALTFGLIITIIYYPNFTKQETLINSRNIENLESQNNCEKENCLMKKIRNIENENKTSQNINTRYNHPYINNKLSQNFNSYCSSIYTIRCFKNTKG